MLHAYTAVALAGYSVAFSFCFFFFWTVTTVELDRDWNAHNWIALTDRLFLEKGNDMHALQIIVG
jgi:hypothetical protein